MVFDKIHFNKITDIEYIHDTLQNSCQIIELFYYKNIFFTFLLI